MASNAKNIINRYGDGSREENRSLAERIDYNMEFKYTKKILEQYILSDFSILEVGCGTGYYGVYLSNKCRRYLGVDITPGNINIFNTKIKKNNLKNVEAVVGDATDLKSIKNESYDVVLAFGPMYHLPPKEVELVFNECRRVCKKDGIVMIAYINKIGVYLDACLKEPAKYPNVQKNKSILINGIDDSREDIYWFSMPEDMEDYARKYDLKVIDNLGVDFTFIPDIYNQYESNEKPWEEFIDYLCMSRSCTGFANHAVMICKKL
ncbi:MAG: class I SAM-dependent methyltransferase [Firmicutes bacterium]|nr:class I SAM-dependent methyltransferase [Bacillota bacterium]